MEEKEFEIAPEITGEDDGELTEELADIATIEELLDTFIDEISETYTGLLDVSLEGNPIKTHLGLEIVGQSVVDLAYQLKNELIERLADRADKIAEQGHLLRKQVLDEGANQDSEESESEGR